MHLHLTKEEYQIPNKPKEHKLCNNASYTSNQKHETSQGTKIGPEHLKKDDKFITG